ncbi:Uma2 family endonuclease [Streptomyces sp. NPDC101150]|uniref:Uma2 family endonuclease n=1 Tax=Streptomyces sp. NPDC101150 TaxID=3366114 RepID=UPI00381B7897
MTALADRPHMQLSEFEELARLAARTAEGLSLEFIDGRLGIKAVPDGDHDEIVMWLQHLCMQHRPELGLYAERGLVIRAYREGRARPDGTLAPRGSFSGQPEWADPEPVLMAVEVTSYDRDTDRRDRQEKPQAYAATGIPVYLLIDRDTCEVTVFSKPDGDHYDQAVTVRFGTPVEIPAPVGLKLDTEPLKDWVN